MRGEKRMIYACLDHVELALEAVMDETQSAPQLEKVDDVQKLSTACDYCKNLAIYVVTNTYSHTECGQ
jgi:CxxH/CxxC protein (TIGR04129 family)